MNHASFLRLFLTALCMVITFPVAAQNATTSVPDPESFFGFSPGEDRKLFDYEQLVDYLERVAQASPRVAVEEFGRSTLDRPMMLVIISAPDNLERIDELKQISRRLALDPGIPDDEREAMIEGAPVIVMATLSMHSTEVGPAQTLPLLTYRLATADDPASSRWLDDLVIMIVATLNPDGMDMIVDHYREGLDTAYEGGTMPGLYHHYVGHDNNRDFVALNLSESRAVSRLYSTEWYPQVLLDKHQMGRTGPRYFVPRYHDPIAENISGDLWTWSDVFGAAMAKEIAASGLTGVASNWVFDEYWPGATTTSHWKNMISLLTECASARLATPIFIEPNERRVRGKGLSEYKKSVNMPSPWPGGWWRLGDIVQYELASWRGVLQAASLHRAEILRLRNDLCRREVARGRTEPPFYYVIPTRQHDAGERRHLVELLEAHGVEVFRLTDQVEVDDSVFVPDDLVVPLAQPYRSFVKEVMERQRYPVRHYTPGGEVIRPYDITSWSLPLHLGVDVSEVRSRSEALETALVPHAGLEWTAPDMGGAWGLALDPRDNTSFRVVFNALREGLAVYRAAEDLTAGEVRLGPGAFVVRAGSADLTALAADARSYPLERAPEEETVRVRQPRVGLVETWFHDMDAGWTRYLLESYGLPYTLIRPGDVADTDLRAKFDVVIFPDADPDVLTTGKFKWGDEYRVNDYRPEYREGIDDAGKKRIASFLESGGTIVSWGRSVGLLLGTVTFGEGDDAMELELPVRDGSEGLEDKGLYVPGSLLAVELVADHPLTWGMPVTANVFSSGRPVLETSTPMLITDRRVVGFFPEEEILVSGYAEEIELLAERPAMVWARAGRGQLVLIGFHPQFRASTPATFKLLFNAILLPEVGDADAGVPGAGGRAKMPGGRR